MGIELNIKPEDIDALVRESIMKAGFGNVISKAITEAFSGFNNPVNEAIRRYVGTVCSELLREKYAEEVKAAVAREIEKRVTTSMIDQTVDAAMQKMVDAAQRY